MRDYPADPEPGGAFRVGAYGRSPAEPVRRKPVVVGLVGSGEAVRRHAETIAASPLAVIGGLCDIAELRPAASRRAAARRPASASPPSARPASSHRFAAAAAPLASGPAATDRAAPLRPSSPVPLPRPTAWERMLADADIELIVLCTPSHTHRRLATQALFARKAVLLDQPALRSESELDRLLALAARCGRPIGAMFP